MQDLLDLDLEEQKLIDSLAIDLWTLRTATEDFGSTMRISKVIVIVLGFLEIRGGASVGAGGSSPPTPGTPWKKERRRDKKRKEGWEEEKSGLEEGEGRWVPKVQILDRIYHWVVLPWEHTASLKLLDYA